MRSKELGDYRKNHVSRVPIHFYYEVISPFQKLASHEGVCVLPTKESLLKASITQKFTTQERRKILKILAQEGIYLIQKCISNVNKSRILVIHFYLQAIKKLTLHGSPTRDSCPVWIFKAPDAYNPEKRQLKVTITVNRIWTMAQ